MTYASLIQPVLWAIFGGLSLALGVKALFAWRRKQPVKRWLKAAIVPLLISFIVIPAIAVVPAGNRGVIYRWDGGIAQKPRGEGVGFIVPWLQHLTTVSVRTQKVYSSKVYAQSADLQEITVVASVNFHIDPPRAPYLYQHVGPQYATTVIQPALFQRTKAAVGQIKAEDFALERDSLAKTVQKQLTDQLAGYGIIVEYVNIEDAIFDPAFVKSVKLKIIAQQEAKRQHNLIAAKRALKTQTIISAQADARATVINAQADAKATLVKARAQAKANRKIAESVTSPLLGWQYLQSWDGTLPTTLFVNGDKNPALFLGVNNAAASSGSPSIYYGSPSGH